MRLTAAEARKLGALRRKPGTSTASGKENAQTTSPAPDDGRVGMKEAAPSFLLRLMTYKMPHCKLGPEDREARIFSDQLRAWTLKGRLRCVWWHTASELAGGGGRAAQIRYAVAKALGLIPGSPDYVFLDAELGSFALELKSKTGNLTSAQRDFQAWCERSAIPYARARGAEEAVRQIEEWGLLKSE